MTHRGAPDHPPSSNIKDFEVERLHHHLGDYFLEVERAVRQGRFTQGAFLLGEMIRLVKSHFECDDSVPQDVGPSEGTLDNLIHNAFIERAREIQSRCLKQQEDGGTNRNIHDDLVFLLSDIVEEDFRIDAESRGISA